ncbi:MAG: tetraacyldisaccharide 4'-kinase [Candidatus Sumerlaeaceae bacterium]
MSRLEKSWQRYARWLMPLGSAYAAAMRLRASAFRRGILQQRRASLPVVSVGNLHLGGSGKTPVVEWLARALTQKGYRPAIVSRGYGRRTAPHQLVVVSDGYALQASPEAGGDEPVMLAKALPAVPIVVCGDRYRAALFVAEHTRADCIILDDGFQHLALARDFDLVLLDASICHQRVFPAGYLREPLSALSRADAFVLPATAQNEKDFLNWLERTLPERPQFWMQAAAQQIECPSTGEIVPPTQLAGTRVLGFAGIAAPQRFFDTLRKLGLDVVEQAFEDHACYTRQQLAGLIEQARCLGCAALITTAKDAVKIPPEMMSGQLPLYVLRLSVDIEPKDELLKAILARFEIGQRLGAA